MKMKRDKMRREKEKMKEEREGKTGEKMRRKEEKEKVLEFAHIPRLHDDFTNTRHETQPHSNRVGALIWSHPGD